jgi:hypothetical protein
MSQIEKSQKKGPKLKKFQNVFDNHHNLENEEEILSGILDILDIRDESENPVSKNYQNFLNFTRVYTV